MPQFSGRQNILLARYFPVQALTYVEGLLTSRPLQLIIKKDRLSRMGDFRPASQGQTARISINSGLNVYAFLLVFLHEYAHFLVWLAKGKSESPHGNAWKKCFGSLIREAVQNECFCTVLDPLLLELAQRPKASGLGGRELSMALRMFDTESCHDEELCFVEELAHQAVFVTAGGHVFRKGDRVRSRFRCYSQLNSRIYLFHPLARVKKKHTEESVNTVNS